jgi:hypothetical protein
MAEAYINYFPQFIKKGVDNDLLDEKLLQFDLKQLAAALKPERDLQFDYLGLQTLYDRYFLHVRKTRIEMPQAFFMRVAMGLSLNEINREARAIEFYEVLSSFDFMSSTPTLFNSGTMHSQLSSCYLYKVDDSIESIMIRGIAENAFLSKWAGGLGGSWTAVRGTGSGGWECTDAVWITSNKQVGIGTTSPSTSFDLTVGTSGFLVNGSTTTSNILGRLRIGSSSSTSYELQVDGDAYLTSGLRIGTTTAPASGGILANGMIETNSRYTMNSSTTGTGTTVIRTSSGELRPQSSTVHVKDNIQTLTVDKNKLFALRPVSYNLKPALGGDREIGLVAEEVETQVPDLVIYGPERQWVGNTGIPAVGPDGRELINPDRQVPWSVRYDRLPVYLLEVIKEQDAAIRRLEERLSALEKASNR